MDSATTTTGVEVSAPASFRRRKEERQASPEANNTASDAADQRHKTFLLRRYRHVAAVHSTARPSTLSHDTQASPSFVGFRNLMVIVLVVGNLRLVIENMQKVE